MLRFPVRVALPDLSREAEVGTMQTRNLHTPIVAAAVLLVAGAFSLAIADQVVYFSNGKAMMVKKIETGDLITILEIEGGGRIGVPTSQIVRIEEYAVSKPNNVRPPAAPQSRTATRARPAAPGGAVPGVSGAGTTGSAAVNSPANLVADVPSVVPGGQGSEAEALAARRDVVQPSNEAGPGAQAEPALSQVSGQSSKSAAAASARAARPGMASRQGMTSQIQRPQRGGQLNNPRGRLGGQRGQALLGGSSPRRPGQGTSQGGASVPASARGEEEIILAGSDRSGRKGGATAKKSPPAKDEAPEEAPSEAD